MNMIPPAIAMFSSMLKKDGHEVEILIPHITKQTME